MAFVNDYLTEEEKKKFAGYQLKYAPNCPHNSRILGTDENIGGVWCTVDRERKIYLFYCGDNYRISFDCADNSIYRKYFALVIDEETPAVVYVSMVDEWGSVENDGYRVLWKLKELDNRSNNKYLDKDILVYVKEALHVYGRDGEPGSNPRISKFDF